MQRRKSLDKFAVAGGGGVAVLAESVALWLMATGWLKGLDHISGASSSCASV